MIIGHDAEKLDSSRLPHSEVTLRQLSSLEEYGKCVELQKETWGDNFQEFVPASILKISQKVGGVVVGAFDGNNALLGFVFGLTGVKEGRLIHWSHMLAVAREVRGIGLGKRLKLYQRELLLSLGVDIAYWTYDPLVARNAQLNLSSLGAVVSEYVKDMYLESGGDLHRGLGMDRFIVAWHLDGDQVQKTISGKIRPDTDRFRGSRIVNSQMQSNGTILPVEEDLPDLPLIRVEIPSNVESVQSESMELAGRWRSNTRRAFLWYQNRGYKIVAFLIEPQSGRCFYCLDNFMTGH